MYLIASQIFLDTLILYQTRESRLNFWLLIDFLIDDIALLCGYFYFYQFNLHQRIKLSRKNWIILAIFLSRLFSKRFLMGKDGGFLTPKAIGNRIKAKGLQKLRWYCQSCEKQCRDEVIILPTDRSSYLLLYLERVQMPYSKRIPSTSTLAGWGKFWQTYCQLLTVTAANECSFFEQRCFSFSLANFTAASSARCAVLLAPSAFWPTPCTASILKTGNTFTWTPPDGLPWLVTFDGSVVKVGVWRLSFLPLFILPKVSAKLSKPNEDGTSRWSTKIPIQSNVKQKRSEKKEWISMTNNGDRNSLLNR